MKKVLLIVAICFAFGTYHSVQAQEVDLGLKLGANFSNLNDTKNLDLSSKTGLVAGAFASIGFNKWAIQPEVLYSKEGSKNFDMDYINVPVLVKYYFVGHFLNLQVGPQFGFLTHDSIKDQAEAKDFDLSGAAGLGLDLPLGIRLDARYNFGLTKVTEDHNGKKGVFTVAIGYSFL